MTVSKPRRPSSSVSGGGAASLVGKTIGQVRLEQELGRGGMGTVYQGRHVTLNKLVAVKILRNDLPTDIHAVERFIREARAAARLDHPNIVGVHDAGHQGDLYYIVMQYVRGESLGVRLDREQALPVTEALRIFRAVCAGIAHAHAHGLVHRDVKPDNILLGEDGEVKIVDFGLARALEGDPNLSRTGTILGSPNFMSPEQALGHRVDQRSDIYSLGATLYHMVAGAPPYQADSALGIFYKVVREPLQPPHLVNTSVSVELSRYICFLMRKNWSKRVASVEQIIDILDGMERRGGLSGCGRRRWRSLKLATALAGVACLVVGLCLSPWPASWFGVESTSAASPAETTEAVEAVPADDLPPATDADRADEPEEAGGEQGEGRQEEPGS